MATSTTTLSAHAAAAVPTMCRPTAFVGAIVAYEAES
jgi:hypothetical protein